MMRSILKRPQAERDIEECFVYIGERNLDAVFAFLLSVEKSLELLATAPYIGFPRSFPDSGIEGLRMWLVEGFKNYEIFYLVDDDSVDVVRVLHAARDIAKIFRRR